MEEMENYRCNFGGMNDLANGNPIPSGHCPELGRNAPAAGHFGKRADAVRWQVPFS
jgi:hypothetical protein